MRDEDKTKDQLIGELTDQRHLNAGLIKSNNGLKHILSALVENLSEGIVVTDLNGRITYVNRSTERLSGYSRHDLTGVFPEILNGEKDVDTIQQQIVSTLIRSERLCREIVQRRNDGSTYLAELEFFPVTEEDGTTIAWASIQRDITKRKRMEKALMESEARLRRINDNMLDMICQTNAKGAIIYISPSHKTILGYGPEDMLGRSVLEFVHPEDLNKVATAIQTAIDSVSPGKTEYRYRHANGHYLWLESTGNLLLDDKGRTAGAIFCTRDITDRKLAEQALRESENKFRQLFERSGDALLILDEEKIIDFNQAALEMIGCSDKKQLLSVHPAQLSPERQHDGRMSSEKAAEVIKTAYDRGTYRFEWVHRRLDGEDFYAQVTLTAVPLGDKEILYASCQDITAKKQAEKLQRLSEERFSKAFNFNPSPMAIYTFEEGRHIDVNDSYLRVFGFSREEVIGLTPIELGIWEKHEYHYTIREILTGKGLVRDFDIKLHTKTGEARSGLLSAEIIDLNGEQCILCVVFDITERKALEQEIYRLDRLNLVGEMAAGIGHEIRNPMTAVRGFLQMLGSKEEYSGHKKYFNLMIEELDRANSIITEFLSLAKNKAVDLKAGNLNNIVKVIFPLIQADALCANKYVKLELENISDLLLDEKEIRQLILNLARNGLEAMSPGGSLAIGTFTDGEEVVLAVKDQGTGIKPDALEKLGTPFFTTKDNGTGLGLAICYSIAARHNAAIKVKTKSGGTTFFVRFNSPKPFSQRLI